MLAAARALGFTLLEVLAAVIILGTLAAVLYPTIAAQLRHGQAAALGSQLDNVREAVANYQKNVGQYPRQLTQLTVQPAPGALDLCGTTLSGAERNRWRGPYLTQNVTGDIPAGDAIVKDTLLRVPPTTAGTPVGMLLVRAIEVDSTTAADLEAQFDGNGNYAAGTILWSATGPQIGWLTFQVPIRGC